MPNQLSTADPLSFLSPLAQPGEDDEARIWRLRQKGTVLECLTEASYWLGYYLDGDGDDGEEVREVEPVSTARALIERAMFLVGGRNGSFYR